MAPAGNTSRTCCRTAVPDRQRPLALPGSSSGPLSRVAGTPVGVGTLPYALTLDRWCTCCCHGCPSRRPPSQRPPHHWPVDQAREQEHATQQQPPHRAPADDQRRQQHRPEHPCHRRTGAEESLVLTLLVG